MFDVSNLILELVSWLVSSIRVYFFVSNCNTIRNLNRIRRAGKYFLLLLKKFKILILPIMYS